MQRQQPTLEDRLILAQVVHLLGASEWQFISNSLLRVSVDRGKQIAYTALVSKEYAYQMIPLTSLSGMRDTMDQSYETNKC